MAIVKLDSNNTGDIFVIPTGIVDKEIKDDFEKFVERGVNVGKWTREEKMKNHKHRQIMFKSTKNKKWLEEIWKEYKNNWDILEK
ncbi:MAG: hypothetical protein PHI50_00405 [Alphaproteobacteria bacterium]|nr:hypothetical protein [Alphaproteobacteria bacterium]